MPDLLAGLRPRPSTPVPGLWLLPAPEVLNVYVFASAAGGASGSAGASGITGGNGDTGGNGGAVEATIVPAATTATSSSSLLALPAAARATTPTPTPAPTVPIATETSPAPAATAPAVPDAANEPPVPAPAPTPPASSLLDALRADPLERAWCAINSGCSEVEVRCLFAGASAVVRPATAGRERELWVFSRDEVAVPDGCIERPRPTPISLAATLTCPAHGHALSCLGTPGCEPTFTADATWHIFEAAAGEKLAWAMGMRIALLTGDIALGPEPFDVRLRPASQVSASALMPGIDAGAAALTLSARPRPPPHCAPFPPAPMPGPGAEPMILRPLSLPALLIAPQQVHSAQDHRLSSAFDATLGIGWKAGRTESRVAAQARGALASDWSVYFVPLSAAKDKHALTTALPGSIAAKWRGAHGVITIWPTHLARPLAPPRRPESTRPPNPGPGLGPPADLLSTATGLFEFFASYSEPEPEPEEEEEPEETEEPIAVEDDTSSKREDESVDDLFSAHSSPAEPEPEVVEADLFGSAFTTPRASALELDTGAPEDGDGDINMDDVDDLFGDADEPDDEPAGEPEPEAETKPATLAPPDEAALMPPSRASEATRDDETRNMITEDDFNFFDSDSPKPDGDVELEVATPETPKGERVFEPTGAEPAFEVISRPVSPTRSHPSALHMSLGMSHGSIGSLRLEAISHRLARHKADSEQLAEESIADISAEAGDDDADIETEPPAKRPRFASLVPPAFSPLQLSARRRPRFPYGLPSPAATVSGLNTDLIERLRQSQKKPKTGADKVPYECSTYDYTATWDVDSDSDDTEDDSALTTGAPPTPSSTADMDDGTPLPSNITFPPPPPPAMTDDEVEFDGGVCVAGEWATLKDDPVATAPFARAWASSWVEVKDHRDAYPSPSSPGAAIDTVGTRLGDIDVDNLANTVLRNRFFREIFDTAATQQEPSRPPTILVKSGMSLSELSDDGADGIGGHSKNYTLPPATINVGYGGNLMRISAAGLRYWRELGLAPAGGPKDITAYALCEPGDETTRTAAAFLKDIGEVYSAHQLGNHEPGGQTTVEDEGEEGEEPEDKSPKAAKEKDFTLAVVAAPLSSMLGTIARLRAKAVKQTVIYVITHNSSISPAALAPLLASPNNISVVHVVPAAAIRVHNLMPVAFEVYDQFPRHIARVNLHGKPLDLPPKWLPYHAFTVAGEEPKPQLIMSWPQKNYDVFTRWRSVHASWAWLPNVGILVLAVTDAQGDAVRVRAIKMDAGSSPAARTQRAWDVFHDFAADSAVEWRLNICASSLMTKEEIDAWRTLLGTRTEPVTLMMLDPPAAPDGPLRPRPPVSNIPPSTFADPGASIVDETLIAGCVPIARRVAVDLPSASGCADDATCGMAPGSTIYPSTSFVFSFANQTGTGMSSCLFHVLLHRPPPGVVEDVQATMPDELHRLACLGRRRWGLNGVGVLPVESVGVVRRTIEAIAMS